MKLFSKVSYVSYIFQFGLIIAICFAARVIVSLLPFAFPAGITGLVLLLLLLCFRVIKLEHINDSAAFILANMSILFVPSGVNMMNYFPIFKQSIVQIFVISVITLFITFGVTAWTVTLVSRLMHKLKAGQANASV
jgi:holin-like protein